MYLDMAVERATIAAPSTSPPPQPSTHVGGPSSSPPTTKKPDMFTCQICFDDLKLEACRELGDCVHKYCVTCMRQYLRVIATESKKFPIPCPDPSCDQHLDPQLCIVALEGLPHDAEALSRLVVEKTHCTTVHYCANTSCGTPFDFEPPHRSASDDAWRIECPLCKTATCVRCKTIWHAKATCAEAKAAAAGSDKLVELAKKEKWKSCPKCGEVIERISGCNYMRCRCGARFCYACGTPYKNAERNNRNPHGTPGCECGLIAPRREGHRRLRLAAQRYRARHMEERNRNLERFYELRRRRNLARAAAAARQQLPRNEVPVARPQPQKVGRQTAPQERPRPRARFTHTASSVRPNLPAQQLPASARKIPIPHEIRNNRLFLTALPDYPGPINRPDNIAGPVRRRREGTRELPRQANGLRRVEVQNRRDGPAVAGALNGSPPVRDPLSFLRLRNSEDNSTRNAHERDVANLPRDLNAVQLLERNRARRGSSSRARIEVIDVDKVEEIPAVVAPNAGATAGSAGSAQQSGQELRRLLPMRRRRRIEGAATLSEWLARRRGGAIAADDSALPPRVRRRSTAPGVPWFASMKGDNGDAPVRGAAAAAREELAEEVDIIDVDELELLPKKAVRFRLPTTDDSVAPVTPEPIQNNRPLVAKMNGSPEVRPLTPEEQENSVAPIVPPEILMSDPPLRSAPQLNWGDFAPDWLGGLVNVQIPDIGVINPLPPTLNAMPPQEQHTGTPMQLDNDEEKVVEVVDNIPDASPVAFADVIVDVVSE